MSVRMASPWPGKGGMLYLRQRTPRDLLASIQGAYVELPIGDHVRRVKIGDIVQISLGTKDQREGKARHAIADAALRAYWDAARALSARKRSPYVKPAPRDFQAASQEFGEAAERILREHNQPTTGANVARVISEMASIYDRVGIHPRLDGSTTRVTPFAEVGSKNVSLDQLWNLYVKHRAEEVAPSTINRYTPSVRTLIEFVGNKSVLSITDDDVYHWAEKRRDTDGINPRVVNRNDLVAVNSLFKWAMSRAGGRIISVNPAAAIRLSEPKRSQTREKHYRDDEIARILSASHSHLSSTSNPYAARAIQWCPWLQAYSGARISELTALRAEDIWFEQGSYIMHFEKTKVNLERSVPLHEHIIALGFLDVVKAVGSGPLFYDGTRHGGNTTKTPPNEYRSRKMADWVRSVIDLPEGVDPTHAWRHTFKNRAIDVMSPRVSDAITGHSARSVARQYESPTIPMMASALAAFPRYRFNSK